MKNKIVRQNETFEKLKDRLKNKSQKQKSTTLTLILPQIPFFTSINPSINRTSVCK